MRRPPIEPRALLLAALTGRPDGKRNQPMMYPAFERRGYVQLAYRDRQTARRLERAGLLDVCEGPWSLPYDMRDEMGADTFIAIGCWGLTPLGFVVARACLRRKI
jgi:hypothetical protein